MTKETRESAIEQLRSVNDEDRTFDFIASTFDIDSYGTRIDPSGWDLEAFKKNPVMCLQHDDRGYTGSNGLPVANVIPESIRVDGDKLIMKGRAPAEGTFPLADTVYNLLSQGFIRGISVGFEPIEWEDVDEQVGGINKRVRIYRKQRLLEVSIVTIPSNDNALVLRAAKLNKDLNVVRRMTEQVEDLLKKSEDVEKPLGTITVKIQSEDSQAFDEQVKEIEKHRAYFEQKQPINKLASRAMEKFFKRVLKEEQPADEAQAWERMNEAIETMSADVSATLTAIPSPAEAPQEARKASVQVPIHLLTQLPVNMTRQLVEVGVEALRRGRTKKEADKLIDGLNKAVSSSLSL